MPTITKYPFIKTMDIPSLVAQVQASSIVTVIDHVDSTGSETDIWFKDALSESDVNTLNTVVTNYVYQAPPPSTQNVSVQSSPPFGSKTITVAGVTKKLFARNIGFQSAVIPGTNLIVYTATYSWAKILGVEVVNCEALDTVDFKVYDTAVGTYSGIPNALLNQFAYTHNLPKDYYLRMSQFDADIYAGMIIKVTYISSSAKTVGINLIMNEVK